MSIISSTMFTIKSELLIGSYGNFGLNKASFFANYNLTNNPKF